MHGMNLKVTQERFHVIFLPKFRVVFNKQNDERSVLILRFCMHHCSAVLLSSKFEVSDGNEQD